MGGKRPEMPGNCQGMSKIVRKLVRDGQEMVQVVGNLSEIFRKWSKTAGYAQEIVQDGQEMVENCEDGLKWSGIF